MIRPSGLGEVALLHLGEGRRRRVTKWRRFLPRELQQALKALNPDVEGRV
jgi:hypothetical protein